MADQKALEEKYYQIQLIDRQLRDIEKQVTTLDDQIVEVEYIKKSLLKLQKVPAGSTILVPISQGIFAKAKLLDANNLIVNVGTQVTVNKTVGETQELLEKQQQELAGVRQEILTQMQTMIDKVRKLEKEIETNRQSAR